MEPGTPSSSPNPSESLLLRLVVPAALWAMACWQFGVELVVEPLTTSGVDFEKHWIAARELLAGRSPYTGPGDVNLYGFNYPMFTAAVYAPLAAFSVGRAELVWDACGIGAAIASIWIFAVGLRPESARDSLPARLALRNWAPLVACLVASFKPLQKVLQCGNVDPTNLLLGSLLAYCVAKRRDRLGGAVFAAFVLVKVAPVLLALPLAALRRARLLAVCAGSLAAYGLLLLATGWWRHELFLVREVLPALPFQWSSLSISVHKWAVAAFAPEGLESRAVYDRWVFATNALLGSALAAVCAWRWKRGVADEELFLAFGFLALLVASPLAEVIHLVWALPAMVLHLRAGVRGTLRGWLLGAVLAGWFAAHWMDPLRWTRLARLFPFDWWIQTLALTALVALAAAAGLRGGRGASRTPHPLSF